MATTNALNANQVTPLIALHGGTGSTSNNNPVLRYVDYVNGSDSNDGSEFLPWLTLQHAYTTLSTIASINNPCTIFISTSIGGTSPDSGTITGYPNINLQCLNGYAYLSNDINIAGTSSNEDSITLTNIQTAAAFTWSVSNTNILIISGYNSLFNAMTVVSTGSGSGGVFGTFVNCSFQGSSFFTSTSSTFVGCTLLDGSITFEDGSTLGQGYGFASIQACDTTGFELKPNGSNSLSVSGITVANGGGQLSIEGTTVGPNSPSLLIDSASTPNTSITGIGTVTFATNANQINSNYTPSHYTATSTDVTGNLQGIDNALAALTPFSWVVQTGSTTLAANKGYFVEGLTTVTLTLPTTAAVGATFIISRAGLGNFTIAQNSGQAIRYGNLISTTGTGGSLTSTSLGDTITLVCSLANDTFQVVSSIGNLTII